jgi:hypothetical protein
MLNFMYPIAGTKNYSQGLYRLERIVFHEFPGVNDTKLHEFPGAKITKSQEFPGDQKY